MAAFNLLEEYSKDILWTLNILVCYFPSPSFTTESFTDIPKIPLSKLIKIDNNFALLITRWVGGSKRMFITLGMVFDISQVLSCIDTLNGIL